MLAALRQRRRDMATVARLLKAAECAAHEDGEAHPGAEHAVIAALDLPGDGTARAAFARVGADADGFADAVRAQHDAALRAVGVNADLDAMDGGLLPVPEARRRGPFHGAPSLQPLMRETAAAVRRDRTPLTGAHIVRAAARPGHGTVARTLVHMGIDPDHLVAAASAEISALGSADGV